MTRHEKLNPQSISNHLLRDGFIKTIEVVDSIESTNQFLRDAAKEGTRSIGACLVAESQSAGKGRMGRAWHSVPGESLTFSFLCPNFFPEKPGWMTLGVATALSTAIERMAAVDTRIKWPNDLYMDHRKLAGILAQAVHAPTGPVMVIGVGLNVNAAPPIKPSRSEVSPVSLRELTGSRTDRSLLLAAIINEVHKTFLLFERGDTESVFLVFKQRSLLMGARARFRWKKEIHEGTVIDHTRNLGIVLDMGDAVVELPGETAELLSFQV
ncbi:MAG: biotin--[acetyl-CoA-carboxylase] ligase [Planctomycetota bacterium]